MIQTLSNSRYAFSRRVIVGRGIVVVHELKDDGIVDVAFAAVVTTQCVFYL